MKSIVPKSGFLGICRAVNEAYLERIIDANQIDHIKGTRTFIVPDEAMDYLNNFSNYFKVKKECIATGLTPDKKYEDKFTTLINFPENKIFNVNLKGDDGNFMKYLNNNYLIEN